MKIKRLQLNTQKTTYIFMLLLISLAALLVRIGFFNFAGADYRDFLNPWWNFIKSNGGFSSLKYNKFDYTPPYLYLLAIGTYFDFYNLFYIKILSVFFDFIAAAFVMVIVKDKYKSSFLALLAYGIILFLPTVILNGACWAQCDVIFTTFIVISIYFMLCSKYSLATVFYGIAFSFKIQAIFVLPLFAVLLFKKKIKIRDLLLIPITYILTAVPCILLGRPIKDALLVYMKQGGEYTALTLNLPNIYFLIPKVVKNINVDLATKIGIIVTFLAVFIIFCVSVLYIKELKKENIIELALIFAVIVPFLLPRMHERYFFLADILSILYVFYFPSRFYTAIIMSLVSLFAYFPFLFGQIYISMFKLSCIMLINVIIILYHFFNKVIINYRKPNLFSN